MSPSRNRLLLSLGSTDEGPTIGRASKHCQPHRFGSAATRRPVLGISRTQLFAVLREAKDPERGHPARIRP
jgi:hypothetical protein